MTCKPDTKTTDGMYALYSQGYSCTQVAKAYGVTRQSVWKRFRRQNLPLRAKPDPLPFVMFEGRKYTLRKCGYYGCTKGVRGYLHRHVWERAHGIIPDGWDIHHRDGDKANNALSNLELYPKAEHTRRFGHRGNQHTQRRGRVRLRRCRRT